MTLKGIKDSHKILWYANKNFFIQKIFKKSFEESKFKWFHPLQNSKSPLKLLSLPTNLFSIKIRENERKLWENSQWSSLICMLLCKYIDCTFRVSGIMFRLQIIFPKLHIEFVFSAPTHMHSVWTLHKDFE
jgi:hypothetical protein